MGTATLIPSFQTDLAEGAGEQVLGSLLLFHVYVSSLQTWTPCASHPGMRA